VSDAAIVQSRTRRGLPNFCPSRLQKLSRAFNSDAEYMHPITWPLQWGMTRS